jgi:hypothetical protein
MIKMIYILALLSIKFFLTGNNFPNGRMTQNLGSLLKRSKNYCKESNLDYLDQ